MDRAKAIHSQPRKTRGCLGKPGGSLSLHQALALHPANRFSCSQVRSYALWGLLQTHNPDGREPAEVPVQRKQGNSTVFHAHRRDLSIKGEISPGITRARRIAEQLRIMHPRTENAHSRATQKALQRQQCLLQSGRWLEDARVCDHAHELAQAKHRHSPWRVAFRKTP